MYLPHVRNKVIEELGLIASDFFSNFLRFCYQKKAHIFLITPVEFYSWKMCRLEDINENVTSYGNHN